jgi:hypothetical protein
VVCANRRPITAALDLVAYEPSFGGGGLRRKPTSKQD